MMNAPAKKQPKDVNSVTQTRFIMIAVCLAPACVLLGWAVGGLPGLLFALSGSIVAAFAVELLSGRLGDGSVNVLYGSFHRWEVSLYREIATSERNEPAGS